MSITKLSTFLSVPGTYILPVSGTRISLFSQSGLICSRASLEVAYLPLHFRSVCIDSWNTFISCKTSNILTLQCASQQTLQRAQFGHGLEIWTNPPDASPRAVLTVSNSIFTRCNCCKPSLVKSICSGLSPPLLPDMFRWMINSFQWTKLRIYRPSVPTPLL